jgi:hypothetical protein
VRRDSYLGSEYQPAPHVSRGIDSQLGGCAVRRLSSGVLAEDIAKRQERDRSDEAQGNSPPPDMTAAPRQVVMPRPVDTHRWLHIGSSLLRALWRRLRYSG